MGKGSSAPPAPDPAMYMVMAQQTALSAQALDFYKQAYADQQPRQKALDEMNLQVGQSLLTDAATARTRGDEAYKTYIEQYRPVETKQISDAMTMDSASNLAAARGRALADVQQQAGVAQAGNMRSMGRYGLAPDPNRMAAINSQLQAQVAAAGAGGMQNAELAQRDRATALRGAVVNVGRGYPAQTLQYGQAATAGGQAAVANQGATNAAALATSGQMGAGYGTAANINAQALQGWGNIYGNQMQGWAASQGSSSSNMAGLGSLAGMGIRVGQGMGWFGADGGKVVGPGNGVSDSITAAGPGAPVHISNGEYIVPADVVKVKGTEFFDKLLEKHHTPAAMQRGMAIRR